MNAQIKKQRPPGYELFFAPLAVVLNPTEYENVQFAYFISKFSSKEKFRRDGTRSFDHPKSAAWIYIFELNGRDPRVIIDALLHDLSEDSYLLSSYRISLNLGIEVALDVRGVTKLPEGKETTEKYLLRIIARGVWAILAKLCDRLHNLRTMHGDTKEVQREQIEETLQYHLPMLIPALRACGEPWAAYADIMERKIMEAISQYQ